eukprot:473118_1
MSPELRFEIMSSPQVSSQKVSTDITNVQHVSRNTVTNRSIPSLIQQNTSIIQPPNIQNTLSGFPQTSANVFSSLLNSPHKSDSRNILYHSPNEMKESGYEVIVSGVTQESYCTGTPDIQIHCGQMNGQAPDVKFWRAFENPDYDKLSPTHKVTDSSETLNDTCRSDNTRTTVTVLPEASRSPSIEPPEYNTNGTASQDLHISSIAQISSSQSPNVEYVSSTEFTPAVSPTTSNSELTTTLRISPDFRNLQNVVSPLESKHQLNRVSDGCRMRICDEPFSLDTFNHDNHPESTNIHDVFTTTRTSKSRHTVHQHDPERVEIVDETQIMIKQSKVRSTPNLVDTNSTSGCDIQSATSVSSETQNVHDAHSSSEVSRAASPYQFRSTTSRDTTQIADTSPYSQRSDESESKSSRSYETYSSEGRGIVREHEPWSTTNPDEIQSISSLASIRSVGRITDTRNSHNSDKSPSADGSPDFRSNANSNESQSSLEMLNCQDSFSISDDHSLSEFEGTKPQTKEFTEEPSKIEDVCGEEDLEGEPGTSDYSMDSDIEAIFDEMLHRVTKETRPRVDRRLKRFKLEWRGSQTVEQEDSRSCIAQTLPTYNG